MELWQGRIDAAVDAHQFKPDIDVLILDGIPRNVGQAEIMDCVAVSTPDQKEVIDQVAAEVRKQPNVATVAEPVYMPSKTGDGSEVALVNVFAKTAPQDAATTDLIYHLRDDTIPQVVGDSGVKILVGGDTAIFVDFAHVLSSKLPLFIALVVILSFILLAIVFRSFVIPLTAAAMNLLSIGAAFGILVAVYQWGYVDKLFGINRTGPVESFIPVLLFAILFGLSMDYQVFLVSRMHEEYLKSGDNRIAVRNGLATTGKTITAAALIMILVFASFVLGGQAVIKEFGIGLAGGVLVDAVLIRMAVVPSLMMLLGKANWWFPKSLDRILPTAFGRGQGPGRHSRRSPGAGPRTGLTGPDLPGVVFGGGLVPGEELVELGQHLVVEGDVDRIEGTVELADRARPNNGSGDGWPREQPGQSDDRGLVPDFVAELFVAFELGAVRLDGFGLARPGDDGLLPVPCARRLREGRPATATTE